MLGQHLNSYTIRVADMFPEIERQPLIWHVKSPTALTLRRRMRAVLEWPELFERRRRLMDDWAGYLAVQRADLTPGPDSKPFPVDRETLLGSYGAVESPRIDGLGSPRGTG